MTKLINEFSKVSGHKSQTEKLRKQCHLALLQNNKMRSSHCAAVETNLTNNHEIAGLIPGLAQWVRDLALL